jgi:hypothetical protein
MAVDGGWTSIGTALAAPPLLIPQSPMKTPNFATVGLTGNRYGANTATVAANDRQPLHSVLSDPSKQTSPRATGPAADWATGWNDNSANTQATIGRSGNNSSAVGSVRDSGLAPMQPVTGFQTADTRTANANRSGDSFANLDSWAQPTQPTIGAATSATPSGKPATNSNAPNTPVTNGGAQSGQVASQPPIQIPGGQTTGAFNMAGTSPNSSQILMGSGMNQAVKHTAGGATEPQPWTPLILSVLGLVGSLAANLYLGASYLDARQKYQSLVRKTADTLRRVKVAAA